MRAARYDCLVRRGQPQWCDTGSVTFGVVQLGDRQMSPYPPTPEKNRLFPAVSTSQIGKSSSAGRLNAWWSTSNAASFVDIVDRHYGLVFPV